MIELRKRASVVSFDRGCFGASPAHGAPRTHPCAAFLGRFRVERRAGSARSGVMAAVPGVVAGSDAEWAVADRVGRLFGMSRTRVDRHVRRYPVDRLDAATIGKSASLFVSRPNRTPSRRGQSGDRLALSGLPRSADSVHLAGQLSVGFGRLLAVGGAADGGEHVSATSKSRPEAGYWLGSDRGSPNHGSTLASKRVMAQIWPPARVST